MSRTVCIVGYGRIGRLTARLVSEKTRLSITVYDTSERAVERARLDGFEAYLSDTTSSTVISKIVSQCDVIATALPSNRAVDVIARIINAGGSPIVDVSYLPDPLAFKKLATERRVKLFVDTGIAPGLSNILVAYGYRLAAKITDAIIYVGGISESNDNLLGLVASWNMEDLLEEYTRPAKARVKGRLIKLDPIGDALRVELDGIGEFDAMPTDGLRTLLESFTDIPTMIEYTLRYPGHVDKLRMLKSLGLLEDSYRSVHGQAVQPRNLLAKLLEEKLPRERDRLVLCVSLQGLDESRRRQRISFVLDESQSKLGLSSPVLSYLTALVHAWFTIRASEGYGHIGLNTPEEVGLNSNETKRIIKYLEEHGVRVRTKICIEE